MQYNIGQKVICRASSNTFLKNVERVELANSTDPEYEFLIVGKNENSYKLGWYNYLLIVPDDVPKGIGWIYEECNFDGNRNENLLDYNLDGNLIGKRGIGCFERNILRVVSTLEIPSICIKCSYKNEYLNNVPNYVCFNCR